MSIAEAPIPPAEDQVPATVSAPAGGAAPAEAIKSADREYVVLRQVDESVQRTPSGDKPVDANVWMLVASIEASSAEQAIRRAIEKPGTSFLNTEGSTTLVAVPARSWNPSTVAVKVETSIVFS